MAETLAERILRVIKIRNLEGMPESKIALDAGLSKDTVSNWLRKYKNKESGGRTEQLTQFAKHYDVSRAWLITGEGGPFGPNDGLEALLAKDPRRYNALQQKLARTIRDARPTAAADIPPELWEQRLELLRQATELPTGVTVVGDRAVYSVEPLKAADVAKPQASSRIRRK